MAKVKLLIDIFCDTDMVVFEIQCMLFSLKALKMEYFSNKPGPTPGTQLPRPNSNKIVPQKEENMSLKRKIQAQGGKIFN